MLGDTYSLTWFVRVSLLSIPIMIVTGWVGLQLDFFPENWKEFGNAIGWAGYAGAGVALGIVSTAKSMLLVRLSSSITAKVRTILSVLLLDIAATSFFLLVGLSILLWIWWGALEGLDASLVDVILLLLMGTVNRADASIYLPIGAATYAPCLLLLVLLITRIFGSWFSFLANASERFDPLKYPMTSPLVGAIVMGASLVTVTGVVAKFLDAI